MQPQQDLATLAYRVNALEKELQHVQTQLQAYVPTNVNDVQLSAIRSTVERIEKDVGDTKRAITEQKEKQDNLVIRVLWGAMTIIIGGVVSVIVYFITHPGG